MSPFVTKVRQLEDKYAHDGKVSFMYVPESECEKFYQYRDWYFAHQEKAGNEHWMKYARTKAYHTAIKDLFNRIDTRKYTLDEITKMFDSDPVLSNHGHHIHENSSVHALLVKNGQEWRHVR
ncbi:hypothetical protein IWT25_02177 [Secundilactobacillus pentosiphilus]|uniref:Uncharacterized protein n=1 Tax=Secundilactobacillus pentosiphilus TaxID=1714682 RepID=A0A1Z5IYD5_9LACO|nr:hypothetical protein [Secundilactobacillus pentosiphilus]GAX06830.1 hypothetical protein IWT25_02177 [Secundilactobacillus pentosiphilus]